MRALLAFLIALSLASPLPAQDNPGATAQAAADKLRAASSQLQTAKSARDRVKALTATVQAFETGLDAMREGLRLAATRENVLSRQLSARDGEVAQLLGILQTISRAPAPVLMAHPDGPAGAVRSGMLVAEMTPALSARANALRRDVEEMSLLRSLQETATDELRTALIGVQDARSALSQAMADRKDLPQKFTEDPVRTAILISSTETLDAFAGGLSKITTSEALGPLPDIATFKGTLPLPVEGRILRRAGEADAAGIERPGILIAARARSLVTTPTTATIRYHGPLLDYGNVVILEPQADLLFVLTGLETLYGEIGQVLPAGFPVGLMGGNTDQIDQIVSQAGEGGGNTRSETLYIDVRENNSSVDPLDWFKADKE
ncbi:murein hydrolase activator EnvC family protein [Planktotalea arctica]|uniref:murein hydrolase activator EnvC family protein n=2 Tax=Planktotalea arctica TaxID=1481893 RepID=UPI000A16F3B5|nr:peptidoglycan DD-metalloendopeptidase family protein [Planktotalea arctica]